MSVEGRIEAQLEGLDSTLVEPFRAARIAMDGGDNLETVRLLSLVTARAPTFDPAQRRLGMALSHLGRQVEGLAAVESAVALNRSSANLVSLASVLAFPGKTKSTAREQERALGLLLEADALPGGNDAAALVLTGQVALQCDRPAEARTAIQDLETRFPELMATHYLAALLAATEEHWMKAETEIKRARQLGLDADTAESFLESGLGSRATAWRVLRAALWLTGVWGGGLASLCVGGFALSRARLR